MTKTERKRRGQCTKLQPDYTNIILLLQIQSISLSRLTSYHTTTYQKIISESNTASTDNFIDCGLTTDIKSESEEDVPLSELQCNWLSDNETELPTIDFKDELSKEELSNTKEELSNSKEELSNSKEELSMSKDTIDYKEDLMYKFKKKRKKKKSGFSTVLMNDTELEEIRNSSRLAVNFVEARYKCDTCIEVYGSQEELDGHNSSLHVEVSLRNVF